MFNFLLAALVFTKRTNSHLAHCSQNVGVKQEVEVNGLAALAV